MQAIGLRVLLKRIKAIRFMMADKTVKWWKKGMIIAGIVLLFSPIDFIPFFVFPFNIIDDILIWVFILWYLRKELDSYWMGEEGKDLSKKFRGKTMVDDVEYEVEDDDKKSKKKAKEAPQEETAEHTGGQQQEEQ